MADPCGVRGTGEAVGVIDAVWDGPARPGQVILPDGSTDLLVAGDEVRVVGVMSRARILTVTRPVAMTGVRLAPWAAFAVLGVAAHELRDQRVPARELGARGRALADALAGLTDRAAIEARLRAIAGAVTIDRRLPRAIAALATDARVAAVARTVDLSERQLERLLLQHVGLGPKRLARIARLRTALALARRGALADAALAAGYADQAHLAREVRALTGLTPSALVPPRMSGTFKRRSRGA
jgi:AraC-like DNA-binding protein